MSRNKSTAFGKSGASVSRGTGAADLLRKGPQKLTCDVLAAIIATGAAIMIGGTRDGNALVITLLDGEHREKAYPDDLDSWRQTLTDLAAWAGAGDEPPF